MHRTDSTHASRASTHGASADRISAGTVPPEFCENCFSDLVQPVDAKANAAGSVRLTLRCPECHHVRVGECTWEEAREFGRHFARGKAELRRHCEQLTEENNRGEVEFFVVALQTDLIGPDDFAPYRYSG